MTTNAIEGTDKKKPLYTDDNVNTMRVGVES